MRRLGCLVLWLGLCLLCLAAAWGWHAVRQTEARFGPPAASLSAPARWRLALALWRGQTALLTPNQATAGASFTIEAGETAATVARRLAEAGLLQQPEPFVAYLRYKGWDTGLQHGTFRFTRPLAPVALAAALRERPPSDAVLVVLPGWRREEIAQALPSSGLRLTPEAFLQATASAQDAALPIRVPQGASLEGFLAPARYTWPRDATAATVVQGMLARSTARLTPAWQQAVREHGLTAYQGLILASIVQRETRYADEMPLIAAVYLRRLQKGMRLQADPTVQYALGKPGQWWPAPLTAQALQVDSPYNTYLYPGLPPTPIANPGEDALRAVSQPAQTDALYFRAACDGSGRHVFSRTFQEHLRQACP